MIDRDSRKAMILRALEVIIIDEISIANKVVIAYIDRLLRHIDYQNAHLPFGGKVSFNFKLL